MQISSKEIIYGIPGILLIFLAIVAGLYVGVWLCLIGGIIQVIKGCTVDPIAYSEIAYGLLRFFLAGLCGWLTFGVLAGLGFALVNKA